MQKDHNHWCIIGVVHSCFKEKFGVPRQPGIAKSAGATLEIQPPFNRREAFEGLEAYSHVWLQFIFHQSKDAWQPTVRPPRFGGNKRVGVFASRSPVRPNRLGLSVAKLESIQFNPIRLELSGIDVIDGTPVVDVKPYLPYADAISDARIAYDSTLKPIAVEIPEEIKRQCELLQRKHRYPLTQLIIEVLSQDPRPAYQAVDPDRIYGMKLLHFDLRWRYLADNSVTSAIVVELRDLS